MTFYRPFCRLICPYAVLLSLGTWKGVFKLQRTDACIECKKCEKACPTDEAKREDGKAECYLCGRCTDICPVAGSLKYDLVDGQKINNPVFSPGKPGIPDSAPLSSGIFKIFRS